MRTVCTHSTTSGIKRLPWFVVSAVQFERVNVEYTNRCPHTTFDANPAAIPASLGHLRHSPLNHILQSTATSVQFPSGDGVCFFSRTVILSGWNSAKSRIQANREWRGGELITPRGTSGDYRKMYPRNTSMRTYLTMKTGGNAHHLGAVLRANNNPDEGDVKKQVHITGAYNRCKKHKSTPRGTSIKENKKKKKKALSLPPPG